MPESTRVKICPYKERSLQHWLPLAISDIRQLGLRGARKRALLLAYFKCGAGGRCNYCTAYNKGECQGCRVNMEAMADQWG